MTINPLPPSSSPEKRSEILYGVENAVGRGVYFMSNVKRRMDIYFDHRAPSIVVEIPEYKNGYIDIRKRGGKIRAFTEITKDNIHYCKELVKLVDELRHLNGVKGGIAVSESEYMATTLLEEAKPLTQVIFSSVKEVVEQGQYIFDTLWNTAIPAEQKIREIEEGVVPIRTRLINKQDEIIKEICHLNNSADKLSICSTFGGMQMSYNYLFDSYKNVVGKSKKKGAQKEDSGFRWITNIDRISLNLVKKFLQTGIKIRHIKNMPPLSFGVSDKEVALTIEKMEGGKMSQNFLISNEPLYVNHFNSLFEELWKNGVDATHRIRDIEAGVDLADIEVIPSSAKTQDLYLDIVKSCSEEILWIFPTTNAFIRQDKIGAIQLAKEVAKEKNVKVRILVPANRSIEQKIQELKQHCPNHVMDVRYIEQMSETKATILVVDRKASLVMELRDDSKTTFIESIGLSTYSNSRAGVSSYVAIFENLWSQTELYAQLKEANEQLKVHGKMQREFIDIAAHELRTPIQPILGLAQVISSRIKDTEEAELLKVVTRNAKRLQQLTEDILDVTRIESSSLVLNREEFDLNGVIVNAVNDLIANSVSFSGKKKENTRIFYEPLKNKNIIVQADKARITQVISNLLNNAVKFTSEEGGVITVILEGKNKDDNYQEEVIVRIKDTGIGIAPEIMPRLFTKFATKSEKGTGLGLFISKSIIEAHGGRIWAVNNS
ncbi:MAG TPA: HAMP domain-containing sensor histidine kinase, partial [Nitrososphaeraceae archaeon]|nr:HAMP domain-containing sensor histidine kinase [Nitrososphaeraceae archaeon]